MYKSLYSLYSDRSTGDLISKTTAIDTNEIQQRKLSLSSCTRVRSVSEGRFPCSAASTDTFHSRNRVDCNLCVCECECCLGNITVKRCDRDPRSRPVISISLSGAASLFSTRACMARTIVLSIPWPPPPLMKMMATAMVVVACALCDWYVCLVVCEECCVLCTLYQSPALGIFSACPRSLHFGAIAQLGARVRANCALRCRAAAGGGAASTSTRSLCD